MEQHNKVKQTVDPHIESKRKVHHGYQVLLAEDDYEMRKLLAWSLNANSYRVTECKDGNELMKKLGFLSPEECCQSCDLVVSDVRMPGSTGLQVLERACEFENFPPMILVTAFPDETTRTEAKRLEAVAMLEKPFDVDVLLAVVKRILPPGLAGEAPTPCPVKQKCTDLPFPVNITFRHSTSLEPVKTFIRDMASKMNHFTDHIGQVSVVIEEYSPGAHQKHRYRICIQTWIGGSPIVVTHDTDRTSDNGNLYLGIRIAFGTVCRQLKNALSKRRRKRSSHGSNGTFGVADEI